MKKIFCFLIILITININAQEIKIGSQTWTTKNLNVSTFKNGVLIPETKTQQDWEKAAKEKKPAWCYYQNDPLNGDKYGKLYNWYAVSDPRGLAPKGWHVPSDTEWKKLIDFLGGEEVAGTKLKSKTGWVATDGKAINASDKNVATTVMLDSGPSEASNGTNESGFTALPGGLCNYNQTTSLGNACWWCSTESSPTNAVYYFIKSNFDNINRFNYNKQIGFSVRCVKN